MSASSSPTSSAPQTTPPHTGGRPVDVDADDNGIPRIVIILAVIAFGWLAITAAQQLKDIVAPLLLTLNLIIVAYPVQARLNRMGLPRIVGALITGLIVFAILIAFFAALTWSLTSLVTEIPQYSGEFQKLYAQLAQQLQKWGLDDTKLLAQAQQSFNPSSLTGLASTAFSGITGTLSTLIVLVTIIFMSLIDTMGFHTRLQVANRTHPRVVDALVDFARGVRRYWVVSSIFGVIVAAIDVAVLWMLGVPLALVWGVLAFLTNYIPNIGFVIGIIPPALMALLANGPTTALIVVIAYCIINFIVQSVIQPKFNGDAVGVTATVSFLSLLFWAWVLGGLGALLALPATLLCKTVLLDIDPRVQWLNSFVASNPETGDPQVDAATGERWDDADAGSTGGSTAFLPGADDHDPKRDGTVPERAGKND